MDNKTFIESKKLGKIGETAIKDYFTKQGSKIIDVSENESFQKMDIDFIIDDNFIEVKTQNTIPKENKIVLEIETAYNDSCYKQGWFKSTESNILMFYDKDNKICYSIDTKELREFYNKYKHTSVIEESFKPEKYKTCELAFINIKTLEEQLKSLKKINLKS